MAKRDLPASALPVLDLISSDLDLSHRLEALALSSGVQALAALARWPQAAWFQPLDALNMAQGAATGAAAGVVDGAEQRGQKARRRTGTDASASQPATAPARRSAGSALPMGAVTAVARGAQALASATVGTPLAVPTVAAAALTGMSDSPASEPATNGATSDARQQLAAVVQALLSHTAPAAGSRASATRRGALQNMSVWQAPQTAASLLQALLSPTPAAVVRTTGAGGVRPDARRTKVWPDASSPSRSPQLAGSTAAAADPLGTVIGALTPPVPPASRLRPAAPRAASRLLGGESAPPVDSTAGMDTPSADASSLLRAASDASSADDNVLDVISRSLVDQAWLRGVNLT